MSGDEISRLRADVDRLTRNIHGENGLYLGVLKTQERILARLERLERLAEEAKDERERRAVREREAAELADRRRRWILVVAPVVVGGAITSLFGFVTNVAQTWLMAP